MKILGIEFAPINVPLQRRLQTLAAAAWFFTMAFGGFIAFLLIGLLLFTPLWWLFPLYMAWIYFDKETCEKGGRPIKWIQQWTWWRYVRDYFPLQLTAVPDATFNPKKNYLFCCFPHGVLPAGAFSAFCSDSKEYHQLFPHHQARSSTLQQHFKIPFFRELALGLGGISCSSNSLSHVLSKPEGGYIVTLLPGGVAESYNSKPGFYKIVLKGRKGFIKLALKNGSPLVPVISFGETDLFEQVAGPKLHRFQESLRRIIGIAPLVLKGRGFFQYSFGLIPRRKKITTLVGRPLEFDKIETPTKMDIDDLHEKFTTQLKSMFEEYKYKYLKDPHDKFLEIQ